MYQVGGKDFDRRTNAQDAAVHLLEDGIEFVRILEWSEDDQAWC